MLQKQLHVYEIVAKEAIQDGYSPIIWMCYRAQSVLVLKCLYKNYRVPPLQTKSRLALAFYHLSEVPTRNQPTESSGVSSSSLAIPLV